MLIATFGPSTSWKGKQITFDDGRFTLEGHGPIGAADVMEYDRQGHLVWESEGTRAWVGSRATSTARRGAGRQPSSPSPTAAGSAEPGLVGKDAPGAESQRTILVKRVVLLVIGILAVVNVVLALMFLGVIPRP